MPKSRELAVIMFTDIVGYTTLMGSNEQRAFEHLQENRHLHKSIIEQYQGRWIKEMGDGILATFKTASDSIYAALRIHDAINKSGRYKLRTGIHLGEVVFENNDVFGNAVNIASRIQAASIPGAIYVSESMHNSISNNPDFQSHLVEEVMLKNLNEAVRLYHVTGSEIFVEDEDRFFPPGGMRVASEKSIAVLPFVNMSDDASQEYFSDGISEEILNSLANLKDLKVAGRTSSFQFKGKNIDIREVGEKLGVGVVMEGSVRKSGDHLRVTVQLINVKDGFHIWSERFDRSHEDIFTIQDEIALAITEKLKVTMLDIEKKSLIKKPTSDKNAYELYLKGRFYWNKRGPHLKKALEYFSQAVAIDPDFALAYAGIADTYALLGFYSVLPPLTAMPKAKQSAMKALQLDSTLIEAKTTLVFVTVFFDWEWEKGKRMMLNIMKSSPDYAPIYYWYCLYLLWVECDADAAVEAAKNGVRSEPLVSISYYYLAVAYLGSLNYDEALEVSNEGIAIDGNSVMAHRYAGICHARLGRYDEALDALNIAAKFSSRHQWILGDLAWVYSLIGNNVEIQKIYDELNQRALTEYISPLFLCEVAYFLDNVVDSFEFLEKAYQQKDGQLLSCRSNLWPVPDELRADKRFIDFITRFNFPHV